MIEAADFLEPARQAGFRFWSGVPCSFLTPFINSVIADPDSQYIGAANEGDAVAIASGAALGGRRAVAIMQNSGLGNAVSPLSSLNWVFRLPILLIVTLRGEVGLKDEPQHELMGAITGGILDQLQIPWTFFPDDPARIDETLATACAHLDSQARPFALIMRKGTVRQTGQSPPPAEHESTRVLHSEESQPDGMTRRQALELVVENTGVGDSVIFASTGYTGRELFAINDRPHHFYMVGSMGCVSSLALGFSLAQADCRVMVLDGDGALLMRMGNLPTIGACQPSKFAHLLLDNACHESTGGQATISPAVDFCHIAAACGYRSASGGSSGDHLAAFLHRQESPRFHRQMITPGVPENLPRPDIAPPAVKSRFMSHLGIDVPWKMV